MSRPQSGPESELASYLAHDKASHDGLVFAQAGLLFYSPNSKQPYQIPPFQEPTDRSPYADSRHDLVSYDLDDFLPLSWYEGPHHVFPAFIPLDLPYTYPFDPLSLQKMPTRVDIASTPGEKIPSSVKTDLLALESCLVGMVSVIAPNLPFRFRQLLPDLPSKRGGYNKPTHPNIGKTLNSVFRSRDWFLVWIGVLLYSILNFDVMFKRDNPSELSSNWIDLVGHFEPRYQRFASVVHVWLTRNYRKIQLRGLVIRLEDLEDFPLPILHLFHLRVPIWIPLDEAAVKFCRENPAYSMWLPPPTLVQQASFVVPKPFRVPARARHARDTPYQYRLETLGHTPGQDMSTFFKSATPLVTKLTKKTIPPSSALAFCWRYNGFTGLLVRQRQYGDEKHSLLRSVQWGRHKMYCHEDKGALVVDYYDDWFKPSHAPFTPLASRPKSPPPPRLPALLAVDPSLLRTLEQCVVHDDGPLPSSVDESLIDSSIRDAPWRAPPSFDHPNESDYADQLDIAEAFHLPSPLPSGYPLDISIWNFRDTLEIARYRYGFDTHPFLAFPVVDKPIEHQWSAVLEHLQLRDGDHIPYLQPYIGNLLPPLYTYLEALIEGRRQRTSTEYFPCPQFSDLFPTSPRYLRRHPKFTPLRRHHCNPDLIVIGRSQKRGWDLVVRNPTDALHACRLLIDGKSIEDVVIHFVHQGVAFNTLATATRPIPTHDGPAIPIRPIDRPFDGQDVTDFHGLRAGVAQSLGVVRAAYMAGGILWRSIRDVYEHPTEELFLDGPLFDQGGVNGLIAGDQWDNKLSSGEEAALLGAYIIVQPLTWRPCTGVNAIPLNRSGKGKGKFGQSAEESQIASSGEFHYGQDADGRVILSHAPDKTLRQHTSSWLIPFNTPNVRRAGYMGFWSQAAELRYRKRMADMDELPGFVSPEEISPQSPSGPPPEAGASSSSDGQRGPRDDNPTDEQASVRPLSASVWHRKFTISKIDRNLLEYLDAYAWDVLALPPA